jgi:hypothetical protein
MGVWPDGKFPAAIAAASLGLIAVANLPAVMAVARVTAAATRPAQTAGSRRARAAHALNATDTAHLHYVSASGSLLNEQGTASGTIPGRMRVRFDVGTRFTGSFTIYTRNGTITGHGTATPHGSGVYESFAGSLIVSGGSGRYRRARGRAGLYGTFDRNSYGLVVQTTGTLRY